MKFLERSKKMQLRLKQGQTVHKTAIDREGCRMQIDRQTKTQTGDQKSLHTNTRSQLFSRFLCRSQIVTKNSQRLKDDLYGKNCRT